MLLFLKDPVAWPTKAIFSHKRNPKNTFDFGKKRQINFRDGLPLAGGESNLQLLISAKLPFLRHSVFSLSMSFSGSVSVWANGLPPYPQISFSARFCPKVQLWRRLYREGYYPKVSMNPSFWLYFWFILTTYWLHF